MAEDEPAQGDDATLGADGTGVGEVESGNGEHARKGRRLEATAAS